jgi:hypothetical protein
VDLIVFSVFLHELLVLEKRDNKFLMILVLNEFIFFLFKSQNPDHLSDKTPEISSAVSCVFKQLLKNYGEVVNPLQKKSLHRRLNFHQSIKSSTYDGGKIIIVTSNAQTE